MLCSSDIYGIKYIGTRWSVTTLPIQTVLWFCDSVCMWDYFCIYCSVVCNKVESSSWYKSCGYPVCCSQQLVQRWSWQVNIVWEQMAIWVEQPWFGDLGNTLQPSSTAGEQEWAFWPFRMAAQGQAALGNWSRGATSRCKDWCTLPCCPSPSQHTMFLALLAARLGRWAVRSPSTHCRPGPIQWQTSQSCHGLGVIIWLPVSPASHSSCVPYQHPVNLLQGGPRPSARA